MADIIPEVDTDDFPHSTWRLHLQATNDPAKLKLLSVLTLLEFEWIQLVLTCQVKTSCCRFLIDCVLFVCFVIVAEDDQFDLTG